MSKAVRLLQTEGVVSSGIPLPVYFPEGIPASALDGVVPILKGGTGQSTQNAAINALLPTQTTETGKYLTTDGTDSSWSTITEGDLTFIDVLTNDTSTSKHGLAPKLSGNSSQFFDGNGSFSTPSGTANSYKSQSFSSQTSITVTHNFGAYPAVNILDGSGNVQVANNIQHTSINAFTVTFTASTSGTIIATVGSPQPSAFRTATGDTTSTTSDKIIKCTGSGSIITIHSAGDLDAQELNIDNASSTNIFLTPTGAETIEDEASQTLPPGTKLALYSDGSNWRFI